MRILVAHDTAEATGGVESYLAAILPELEARGHEVLALHQWKGTGPARWCSTRPALCVHGLGMDEAIARVRRFAPHVCFSHNMGPLATERRLLAEWPVVKMMHGYFGTCISGLKSHAFPARVACGRTFGPACLALYGPRRCGQLSASALVDGYRWSRAQRALFGRYAGVAVASEHMHREYRRHGVPGSRLHLLPLFSTLRGAARRSTADRPASVLFAGRMTALKGGDVLIAAAACAQQSLGRDVPIVFVGDGPQRSEWQARANAMGVRAEFTGWVAEEMRAAVYGRATIVAVPSVWPEPFGLVGLEAASLGIPAVAFDVGGIRQWLQHGRSGLLVEPSAGSRGLGAAMATLLADDGLIATFGAGAREIAGHMSCAAHIDGLEAVLSNAVRREAREPVVGAALARRPPSAERGLV
jgi:glycosyltransferase involved in cell wall biosynthesis